MTAEQAMAELWGRFCPDCGPSNYQAIVAEVLERTEKNPLEKHLHEVVNRSWNYAGRIQTHKDAIGNAIMGLGGEAGEIVDLHKKIFYHTEKDRRAELVSEFGDLCFYLAKLLELWGITLEECLADNKRKLTTRHPEFFKEEVTSGT